MRLVEESLFGIPSRFARKSHKKGIIFENEYFHKSIKTLKKNADAEKEIERFHFLLREWYGQNASQNAINSDSQLLMHNEAKVEYRWALKIRKMGCATRNLRARLRKIQAITKTTDLVEVFLEVYSSGLIIADVALMNWQKFDLSGEVHIPIEINMKKELVAARTLIGDELKHNSDKYEFKF